MQARDVGTSSSDPSAAVGAVLAPPGHRPGPLQQDQHEEGRWRGLGGAPVRATSGLTARCRLSRWGGCWSGEKSSPVAGGLLYSRTGRRRLCNYDCPPPPPPSPSTSATPSHPSLGALAGRVPGWLARACCSGRRDLAFQAGQTAAAKRGAKAASRCTWGQHELRDAAGRLSLVQLSCPAQPCA